MSGAAEDDRESIDRAFAEMMAGYHLTADHPDAPDPTTDEGVQPQPDRAVAPPETTRPDAQPLFVYQPPARDAADDLEVAERLVPGPPAPLPRPAWPVLIAWLGLGYSILVMLAAVVSIRVPAWAGWLALVGFVGGIGVLFYRLPRSRPPDAGDGAVL